jgi:hypothetical protein
MKAAQVGFDIFGYVGWFCLFILAYQYSAVAFVAVTIVTAAVFVSGEE